MVDSETDYIEYNFTYGLRLQRLDFLIWPFNWLPKQISQNLSFFLSEMKTYISDSSGFLQL